MRAVIIILIIQKRFHHGQDRARDRVAGVQRGMAERPDSVPTLRTINVPTLIITGDEDALTGLPDAELMKQNIAGSQLRLVSKAGHFSPWEQPEEVGSILRHFLDGLRIN